MASNTDVYSNIVVAWTDEDILSELNFIWSLITPIPHISADCLNCKIKRVIFNDPATIVFWDDGTKTVVKCNNGDTYNKEVGLTACIVKKICGNTGRWNEILKKWCHEEDK